MGIVNNFKTFKCWCLENICINHYALWAGMLFFIYLKILYNYDVFSRQACSQTKFSGGAKQTFFLGGGGHFLKRC